ncbi:hypothetical protein J2Z52_000157 [Enterococcus rivorum]|nr:hypothetical protein [Enterococcus rivorum]
MVNQINNQTNPSDAKAIAIGQINTYASLSKEEK